MATGSQTRATVRGVAAATGVLLASAYLVGLVLVPLAGEYVDRKARGLCETRSSTHACVPLD
jgi:hypothetical protein